VRLNYCMECAAPLHRRDATEYVCANGHPYWNEPHASACVVLLDGDRVLVARRGAEPRKGRYVFPGGFVGFGESPYDAARRDVREETGLECGDLTLLEVRNLPYRENEASLSIVFLAREWSGEPRAGDDAAALEWKPVGFIEGPGFAWHFPGLADRLRALPARPGRRTSGPLPTPLES
jgi:ADP-ribose pyrophosphatase YjhB (NUDIX family)